MSTNLISESIQLTKINDLNTLVEHRSTYNMEQCELNVYETYQPAENVKLRFNDFIFTSMLRGKKVMKLAGKEKFDYYPGESVIASPGEILNIDFPEANMASPTQCIALCINQDIINQTLGLLNEKYPKIELNDEWKISSDHFFLFNSSELAAATNNIIRLARDNSLVKDTLGELAIKELLIRLMQTQARKLFEDSKLETSHRLAHIIRFIKENIREKITIDMLSKKAYMSKPHFFRCFKQELGLSPVEYIMNERINFSKQLLVKNQSITDVAYNSGFSNVNYYIRAFKVSEGITPKKFQQNVIS